LNLSNDLGLCCRYSQTGSAKANGRETTVANTLAYDMATITTIKRFTVQAPGVNALKCFPSNTNNMQNMQVIVSGRFFQASPMFPSKARCRAEKVSSWPFSQC